MSIIDLSDLKRADGSSFVFDLEKDRTAACAPGEFPIAAIELEHGHIYGMVSCLVKAGANLKWVWDTNPQRAQKLADQYPGARIARCMDEILNDPEVRLVAAAGIPSERAASGIRCMKAGKDYFVDKTPFTSLEQLAEAKAVAAATGRKYYCFFSERLQSESGMLADALIHQGAIGKVLHVIGMGPHLIGLPANRPDWFYIKKQYGGILNDIGSHQCEQFLQYTDAKEASIQFARVRNANHPEFPEFEDFGEASLVADNGASFFFRVDWFTPKGLKTWGDGRTIITGTDGTIELRKNIDIATDFGGNQLYLFDQNQTVHINANGTVGYAFFRAFIRDCLDRTENAMTQEHVFKASELCIKLQMIADANR